MGLLGMAGAPVQGTSGREAACAAGVRAGARDPRDHRGRGGRPAGRPGLCGQDVVRDDRGRWTRGAGRRGAAAPGGCSSCGPCRLLGSRTRPHRVRACRHLLATAWSSPGAPRRGGGLLSSEPGLGTGALDLSTTLRSPCGVRQSSIRAFGPLASRPSEDVNDHEFHCLSMYFTQVALLPIAPIPSRSVGNPLSPFLHPETTGPPRPSAGRPGTLPGAAPRATTG